MTGDQRNDDGDGTASGTADSTAAGEGLRVWAEQVAASLPPLDGTERERLALLLTSR